VNLYLEARRAPQELSSRLIITTPVDVHAKAMDIDWCTDPPNEVLQRHPLAEATCVVLEAPVMFSTPTVASGMWSERLLGTDLPERVATYDVEGREAGAADMTNLFIELSPLEHTGWELVERGKPLDAIRALWLVREGGAVVLSYFFQEWPAPGALTGVGCIEFEYDGSGFRVRSTSEQALAAVVPDVPDVIRKRLYTALWIAQCCSQAPHLAPFPRTTAQRTNGTSIAIAPWFASAEARLIEVRSPTGAPCVVPRMVGTNAEFYGRGRLDGLAYVELRDGGFGAIDPEEIPAPVERKQTGSQ
jgi:hypothetical protein